MLILVISKLCALFIGLANVIERSNFSFLGIRLKTKNLSGFVRA